MERVNIQELKTHFSRYAQRVKSGETIILCDRNKAFGELRPLQETESCAPRKRPLGIDQGKVELPEDWDSHETNATVAKLFGLEA